MAADRLKSDADRLADDLVRWRRELHRHPELAFEERRTAAFVESRLRDLGLEVKTGLAETGVVGLLRSEDGHGPAVLLRADMDALPVQEVEGREYGSEVEGCMHACGHDGHTAILLGTAMALAGVRDRLSGNVRFLFQPAEEGGAGAARMIEAGALEGVSRIFGLHNWPQLPLGRLATKPGPLMASAAEFTVVVHGAGGHGSQPSSAKDPVLPACHVVTQLQGIVSREMEHDARVVLSVCTIHGGTATNIIPDEVTLSGTVRTLDDELSERIGRRIGEIAEAVAEASGCTASCDYRVYYPVTSNHEAEAALVREVGEELFGEAGVTDEGLPLMGAEDFSFYLQQLPGAYFFLGGAVDGARNAPCHSSRYEFNDELILWGVRCYLRMTEKALGCTLA